MLFLNQTIDINDVFWKIPVEEYWKPVECVVKKQMKIGHFNLFEIGSVIETSDIGDFNTF